MYIKNRLKYENNIKTENIISFVFVLMIELISLTGKKPPDEIIVIAKLKESKVLRLISFNDINNNKVVPTYKKNILNDCLKVSE